MPGPGLALATATDVAAPGDERHRDDDGEDRGQAGAKTCPMQVDEREGISDLREREFVEFDVPRRTS